MEEFLFNFFFLFFIWIPEEDIGVWVGSTLFFLFLLGVIRRKNRYDEV